MTTEITHAQRDAAAHLSHCLVEYEAAERHLEGAHEKDGEARAALSFLTARSRLKQAKAEAERVFAPLMPGQEDSQ